MAALVVFATSAAVVGPPAGAAAPDCPGAGPRVLVTWSGSVPDGCQSFSENEVTHLTEQGNSVNYPFCGNGCTPTSGLSYLTIARGVPVREFIKRLDNVGFGPDQIGSATILTDTGGTATLSGDTHDFAAIEDTDPPFPWQPYDGNYLYPLIYPISGGYAYFRPQQFDGDQNAPDDIQTSQSGVMTIELDVVGRIVKPGIHASRTKINSGQSITFTASVPGGAPQDAKYTWIAGDDPLGTGRKLTHEFDIEGTGANFDVYVKLKSVTKSGDSDLIHIEVGKPARAAGHGPGRGTGDTDAPVNGPNKGTGLHAGGQPEKPSAGPHGASAGGATDAAGQVHGASASPSATASKNRIANSADGFVAVNGILLNPQAAAVQPQAQRRVGQPETAPAARAGAPEHASIVFGASLSAAVLVLLALGMFGESRRPGRGGRRRSHP